MNIEERRSIIARRLEENHTVNVIALADEMNVSAMTVRRDLADLERQGYARRVHGGAILEGQRSFEPTLPKRAADHSTEKRSIVRTAIEMCRQDEAILLDVGSTTLFLAEELRDTPDLRLMIITPSVLLSRILADNPSYTVLVTGGVVRRGEYSLTGDLTTTSLKQFHVDRVFLGIAGISAETGLTEYNMEDATVKRAMVESAKEVVVLADASKFGKTALCEVGTFDMVDVLVTNRAPPPPLRDVLEASKVRVTIADTNQPSPTDGVAGNS